MTIFACYAIIVPDVPNTDVNVHIYTDIYLTDRMALIVATSQCILTLPNKILIKTNLKSKTKQKHQDETRKYFDSRKKILQRNVCI